MRNSLRSGRRIAVRLLCWQVSVALLTGLGFGICSHLPEAWTALAVGVLVALASLLMSVPTWISVENAGVTLRHLITGLLVKWTVIVGGLVILLVQWKGPPLAAITGLVTACAVHLLLFRFKG